MLKRFFHNFLQSFRKDSGAHFTYNLGVGCVRAGAVIIGAALLLFGLSFLHLGGRLHYDSDIRASITDMEIIRHKDNWLLNLVMPKFRYRVDFEFEINGDKREVRQYVSENEYRGYVDLSELPSMPMRCYITDDGRFYLSMLEQGSAEKEYRSEYPTHDFKIAAFWVFIIGLPVLLVGLGEERISMKYPRSDVVIRDTSIVLSGEDTDDLLGEFEREYRKTHRNWLTDPPDNEPPENVPPSLEKK